MAAPPFKTNQAPPFVRVEGGGGRLGKVWGGGKGGNTNIDVAGLSDFSSHKVTMTQFVCLVPDKKIIIKGRKKKKENNNDHQIIIKE